MTDFYKVSEVLEKYRIGRTTFYREVSEGRIPLRKLGRATRVARADIERWADSLPTVGGEA